MTAAADVPTGTSASEQVTVEELQLAARNHGMPLEALRYDVTPVGLHYLLIHYDIPAVDPEAWRLHVGGLVEREAVLSLDDVRDRPAVTRTVTMECAGNGRARLSPRPLSQPWLHEAVGTGRWTGVPVTELLADIGVLDGADEAVFTGMDRGVEGGVEQAYARSVTLDELKRTGALLAYELNGAPLPPQHGAPLRLVVPGWYGMTSVKWLASIELVDAPFDGYQHTRSYRFRQAPEDTGDPVTRVAVRSLLAPPGVPEFFSRSRIVQRGPVDLHGRAWSGHGAITKVEVSADAGRNWWDATLDPPEDTAAWTGWHTTWDADTAGEAVLCCRATDSAGNRQPDLPLWNLGGYAVNAVQRVTVTVR